MGSQGPAGGYATDKQYRDEGAGVQPVYGCDPSVLALYLQANRSLPGRQRARTGAVSCRAGRSQSLRLSCHSR